MGLRFAEWSWACSKMQLHALLEDTRAPAVHYMGLFLPEDAWMMERTISNVTGQFMTKWWDTTSDAGPTRRPSSTFQVPLPTLEILTISDNLCKNLQFAYNMFFKNHLCWLNGLTGFSDKWAAITPQPNSFLSCLRIPDLVKNKYMASHSSQVKALEDKVVGDTLIAAALKGSTSQSTTSSQPATTGNPSPAPVSRTLATPDFEGEVVPRYDTRAELEAKPLDEFNDSRTFLG